ncbi:MAG: hypothetical protein WDN24_13080 [Sphingomonas sp.]
MALNRFSRGEWHALGGGLLIRLLLLAGVPLTYTEWFLPFLTHVARLGGIDPWSDFLAEGGPVAAFPYGPLYFVLLPLTALGSLLGPRGAALGLGLSVLLLDALLLLCCAGSCRPAASRSSLMPIGCRRS